MIKYNLICNRDHTFEGWFSSSSDYENQCANGLIACPSCGAKKIEKAIMAPAVRTARKVAAREEKAISMINAVAGKIRAEIASNCDDVGTDFAEEARAIHYGEKPVRGIYGQASPDEVAALSDEGVTAHPLPDILVPVPKKQVN